MQRRHKAIAQLVFGAFTLGFSSASLTSTTLSQTAHNKSVPCTCRYQGNDIAEGQTICAKTPSGSKLMRCTRVLNNTAWRTLEDECPQAFQLPDSPSQSTWIKV